MRAKVELYPGNGSAQQAPHGVVLNAAGAPSNPPDYGYDQSPLYVYSAEYTKTKDGLIPPCAGQTPSQVPAWIPLDETSQIGVNQTYAGAAPATDERGYNTSPQLIRYSVKMSKPVYQNIVANQFWYSSNEGPFPLGIARANAVTALANWKPSGQTNPQPPFVNFAPVEDTSAPSVFLKSAWRPLSPTEAVSGRFRTAPVRYYEQDDQQATCYREEVWGLVGLHVITYTLEAPWVIWSTFEQVDNILTSGGAPTEDPDGRPLVPAQSSATTPALLSDPSQLNPEVIALGPPCDNPGKRLFFKGNPVMRVPHDNTCLDQRWYQLPNEIIAANATAHEAIRSVQPSVWQYYKLINVQPTPVDAPNKGPSTVSTPASYSLSNAVIETDYSLANFTGRLVNGVPSNKVMKDGKLVEYINTRLLPFQTRGLGFLSGPMSMGGCGGCHVGASNAGGDFSFSLGRNVLRPDPTHAFLLSTIPLSNAMPQ